MSRRGCHAVVMPTIHSPAETMFETHRLLLRRLTLDDVDNLLGIFSDPEAMKYYPATKSRTETIEWIDWNLETRRG